MSWEDCFSCLSWDNAKFFSSCCMWDNSWFLFLCLLQSGATTMELTTRLGRSGTGKERMARWWAAPALGMEKENSSVNLVSVFLLLVWVSFRQSQHLSSVLPGGQAHYQCVWFRLNWWQLHSVLTRDEAIILTFLSLKRRKPFVSSGQSTSSTCLPLALELYTRDRDMSLLSEGWISAGPVTSSSSGLHTVT